MKQTFPLKLRKRIANNDTEVKDNFKGSVLIRANSKNEAITIARGMGYDTQLVPKETEPVE